MPVAEKSPSTSGLDLGGISNLASLFLGKETTSQNTGGVATTGSRTTIDSVPQSSIDAAVQSILQGTQGLASVSSGQKRAGMYNSSTNEMLTNDLIARAAAEGAKLNKTSTTTVNEGTQDTRSTVTKTPAQISPKTAVSGIGALQLLGTLSSSAAGKKVMDSLGLGPAKTANTNTAAVAPVKNPSAGNTTASGSSAPDVSEASMDASGNNAAVSSVRMGNNPSAYTAPTSDNVDVSSVISQPTQDLSFDQTSDIGINGLDLGSEAVGAIGDAASGLGDAGGDWGPDPSSVQFDDFNTDFGDMFNFAGGGYVTPKGNDTLLEKVKKRYAGGGYVNLQAEKAFESGGDEKKSDNSNTSSTSDSGIDFFRKTPAAAKSAQQTEDYKPNKSLGVRMIDKLTGRDKIPGYAGGGQVLPDITNTGLRAKPAQEVDSLGITADDQSVSQILRNSSGNNQEGSATSLIAGKSQQGTRAAGSVNPTASNGSRRTIQTQDPIYETTEGQPGTGIAGTPAENAAAVAGAIGLGISALTGIPAPLIGKGMDALGIPNSPMSPFSQIVSIVSGLIGPDAMTQAANVASANNAGVTASDDNAAMANAIAQDQGIDPLDALIGIVSDPDDASSNDGTSGEGGGIGGSGNSAGNAGEGDGGTGGGPGGDGGGTASAKTGGKVKGPGTGTSDSIDVKVSNGEYIINAAAVDHYGKEFFDHINNSIQPA